MAGTSSELQEEALASIRYKITNTIKRDEIEEPNPNALLICHGPLMGFVRLTHERQAFATLTILALVVGGFLSPGDSFKIVAWTLGGILWLAMGLSGRYWDRLLKKSEAFNQAYSSGKIALAYHPSFNDYRGLIRVAVPLVNQSEFHRLCGQLAVAGRMVPAVMAYPRQWEEFETFRREVWQRWLDKDEGGKQELEYRRKSDAELALYGSNFVLSDFASRSARSREFYIKHWQEEQERFRSNPFESLMRSLGHSVVLVSESRRLRFIAKSGRLTEGRFAEAYEDGLCSLLIGDFYPHYPSYNAISMNEAAHIIGRLALNSSHQDYVLLKFPDGWDDWYRVVHERDVESERLAQERRLRDAITASAQLGFNTPEERFATYTWEVEGLS